MCTTFIMSKRCIPFLDEEGGLMGVQDAIKEAALMEEFGIRSIAYDLSGFGESDPHPERTPRLSTMDISHLADALEVHDKFWLFGYSSGGMHVWAALKYVPDGTAGAAMVNPYDPSMTKEEESGTNELQRGNLCIYLLGGFQDYMHLSIVGASPQKACCC